MKRFQPLVFSIALLLLAACSQDPRPAEATPSFNFSVDPSAGSVTFQGAGAEALAALQLGECGSDDPRVLFAEEELALETFEFVFLPGNILEITASFTNVTDFTFEQPFTFTQADSTSNIISSDEPEVTDADLGGDGELGPGETTSVLTFTVEHRGQPFTYEVLAEAVVRCPGDEDDRADLEVIKTIDGEVSLDESGIVGLDFEIIVRNIGSVTAVDVTLEDLLVIDLSELLGIDLSLLGLELEAELLELLELNVSLGDFESDCTVSADLLDGTAIVCLLGDLDPNDEVVVSLSATLDLSELLDLIRRLGINLNLGSITITITNTATVSTDTLEIVLDNNVSIVGTIIELNLDLLDLLPDLTVTKEGALSLVDGILNLNFVITVENTGDGTAEDVELTDTLLIEISNLLGINLGSLILALVDSSENCTLSVDLLDGSVTTCLLGDIAAGDDLVVELDLTLDLSLLQAALNLLPIATEIDIDVTNTVVVSTDGSTDTDTLNLDVTLSGGGLIGL